MPDEIPVADIKAARSLPPAFPELQTKIFSPKVLGPAVAYMWVPDAAKLLNYFVGMPEDVATSASNLFAVVVAVLVGYYIRGE